MTHEGNIRPNRNWSARFRDAYHVRAAMPEREDSAAKRRSLSLVKENPSPEPVRKVVAVDVDAIKAETGAVSVVPVRAHAFS